MYDNSQVYQVEATLDTVLLYVLHTIMKTNQLPNDHTFLLSKLYLGQKVLGGGRTVWGEYGGGALSCALHGKLEQKMLHTAVC